MVDGARSGGAVVVEVDVLDAAAIRFFVAGPGVGVVEVPVPVLPVLPVLPVSPVFPLFPAAPAALVLVLGGGAVTTGRCP
jgi:hypothetical protein